MQGTNRRVLIDINHPAHVHFFKNPALKLMESGYEVLFTSRDKDVAIVLLDEYGFNHVTLTKSGVGAFGLLRELVYRDYLLYKTVKRFRPAVMLSIGGTFIAHVGYLTRTPSIVFYDTETAKIQNFITYPFARLVVVPECYRGWLPKRHQKYKGYHELSYLHPRYFQPDHVKALRNGLVPNEKNFLVRVVSWEANHDMGYQGWSPEILGTVISYLAQMGNVIISSEVKLGRNFDKYMFKGKPGDLHHLLAFTDLFVGESATLASEACVLGVPAIYAGPIRLGYIDEQETKYGIVKYLDNIDKEKLLSTIDNFLSMDKAEIRFQKNRLLESTIDVSKFVTELAIGSIDID